MQNLEDKMRSGGLYICADPELQKRQQACLEVLYDYNHSRPGETAKRAELLSRILAEVGENCYIEPPLHANWGCHTHIGNNVYANFNLTLVDDTDIYIGDSVMLGPNVVLATAGHPVDPDLRRKVYQFNQPIRLGNNVWLGAGVIVLPGVTIGDNSVIGAGSVVTRDIPPGVVAVGNPCHVVREIGERDREYYWRDLRISAL